MTAPTLEPTAANLDRAATALREGWNALETFHVLVTVTLTI